MKADFYLGKGFIEAHLKKNHEEHLKDVIRDYNKYVDQFLQDQIKEHAKPPIKGEITKGKLKWRGIRICVSSDATERWVEQRGKRIGKIHSLSFKVAEPIYLKK